MKSIARDLTDREIEQIVTITQYCRHLERKRVECEQMIPNDVIDQYPYHAKNALSKVYQLQEPGPAVFLTNRP